MRKTPLLVSCLLLLSPPVAACAQVRNAHDTVQALIQELKSPDAYVRASAAWASAASVPSAEAQGAAGGRTVHANEFILEDERGTMRAVLGVIKDVPTLALYDAGAGGKVRVMLAVNEDGPRLVLSDAAGIPRVNLVVAAKGPMLILSDARGMPIWGAP